MPPKESEIVFGIAPSITNESFWSSDEVYLPTYGSSVIALISFPAFPSFAYFPLTTLLAIPAAPSNAAVFAEFQSVSSTIFPKLS